MHGSEREGCPARNSSTPTYTSSTTHAATDEPNAWFSDRVIGGIVTFNLGSTQSIDAFALWNSFPARNDGINQFELLADTDGNFNNGGTTSLGSFNARNLSFPIPAQIFTFGATSTRFVHLNIMSNHGAGSGVTAGEVAFKTAAAPDEFSAAAPYEFSAVPALLLLGAGYCANNLWKRWKDKDK